MATEINLSNDDVTVNSLTDGTLTVSGGDISGAGTITATSFSGDGSGLTGIAAGGTTYSCKVFMSANSGVNNNTAFTQFNVFNTTDINIGSFTVASSGIQVPVAGVYVVMANMIYNSGSARTNPEFRFTINNTGQTESSRSSYMRVASGHDESSSSLTTVYNLSANDEIGLEFRQIGASGTVNLETGSHVALYRVG